MAQNLNQFAMTPIKGAMDAKLNPSVLSVRIDATSGGGLVAGQAVKLVDSSSPIPSVVECAADTDDVFGFITYDMRRATLAAGDVTEVAMFRGNVMYMEAASAVARGAKVMIIVSGSKVDDATSGKTVIGRALDKATAAGQLIRVIIDLPGTALP